MAKNQPDFGDEQRAAVVRAVLHLNMSRRAAAVAAQSGELGVPAFSISPSTISKFVEAERERLRAERRSEDGYDDPDGLQARLEDLDEMVLSMAEQAADELLEGDGPIDLNRARELVYLVKLLKSALRVAPSGPQSRSQEKRASSLLTELAAKGGPEVNGYGTDDDQEDDQDA